MGIGAIGSHNTTISMNFRWLMSGYELPQDFMRKVKFDYFNKTIEFEYADSSNEKNWMNGLIWATKLAKGTLRETYLDFTALDGCGFPLYKMNFDGIKLISHESGEFNYDSTEISTQKIKVSYQEMELKIEEANYNFGNEKFYLQIFEIDGTSKTEKIPVILKNRPSLKIGEKSLGFLNCKTFITTSAVYEDIKIQIKSCNLDKFSNFIKFDESSRKFNVALTCSNGEGWELKNAYVNSMFCQDNNTNVSFLYDGINYRNEQLSFINKLDK